VLVRILIEDSGVAGGDEQPKRPGMDDMPPTLIYSTLTINVNDVNDPPLFNIPRPTQAPLEDASVSAPGFLNLIFPGKSTTDDELGLVAGIDPQSVSFQVTALDPTRFTGDRSRRNLDLHPQHRCQRVELVADLGRSHRDR
jgi:hypothetical protein